MGDKNIFRRLAGLPGAERLYWLLVAGLLGLFAFIFFHNLGQPALIDYDEAIYAQVARESLSSGQQLELTWKGNPSLYRDERWFEKPPLMIWLTEASIKLAGVNEPAARLPAAAFALATIVVVFFIGRELTDSPGGGVCAAAFMLLAYQFISTAALLQLDIPAGFWIILALYGALMARRRPRWWWLFWIASGLGVMTKSIVGLLPPIIYAAYAIIVLDFSFLRRREFYYGAVAFLVITVPWHVVESFRYGRKFWDEYFLYHVVQRYLTPLETHGHDNWYYWNILKQHYVLWWGSIAGLGYAAAAAIRRKNKNLILCAAGLVVIFAVLSLSHTKLAAYIVIAYPFMAALSGVVAYKALSLLKWRWVSVASVICVTALCAWKGLEYNRNKLAAYDQKYFSDSRAVGDYLKNSNTAGLAIYNLGTGTRPTIIFYANSVIYYLQSLDKLPGGPLLLIAGPGEKFPLMERVFSTPSQQIYQQR